MKRILLGFALGAVIFAGAVGARVVTVTNPMSADLNGGGYDIANVANYQTAAGAILGGDSAYLHALTITGSADLTNPPFVALVFAGTEDPSVNPPEGNNPAPSLYLRRAPDGTGELWFKTGVYDTDWACVAGCSP